MAYETGIAANHSDLLLKLETFLTTNPELVRSGQQWEVMKDNVAQPYSRDTVADSQGFALHRFFVGHGLDGQDYIVVPMVMRQSVSENYYTLNAYMARSYDATKPVNEQIADNSKDMKYVSISLWHTEMKYWFVANGRRFIVIVKVSNRYSTMYCGFIMPSGTDLEYPYPLFLGGNHSNNKLPYSTDEKGYCRSFFNPQVWSNQYSSSAIMFSPDNQLVLFDNYGGDYLYSHQSYNMASTYPYQHNSFMGKTADNEYLLLPIDIVQRSIVKQHLGWFDGVYHVSGVENSPENIVIVDGKNYMCVPSLIQNGFNDWAAICLE